MVNYSTIIPHDHNCKSVIAVMPDGTEKKYASYREAYNDLHVKEEFKEMKYYQIRLHKKSGKPLCGIVFKDVEE